MLNQLPDLDDGQSAANGDAGEPALADLIAQRYQR
jgi:hypothetical protein